MQAEIRRELEAHLQAVQSVMTTMPDQIAAAARLMIDTFRAGGKLLLFGNGGSAGDAQHIAAEFTGRFRLEREGLPAIALSTDSSALTAIGNDYGFERVFARQVEALANPGDLLVGYSTSGTSRNVIAALDAGCRRGCRNLGISGREGGQMRDLCDICLLVPADDTARIQEMHLLLGHTLCQVTETALAQSRWSRPAAGHSRDAA